MHGLLQIQLPSQFDGASAEYADAAAKQVLPIAGSRLVVDGYTPPAASGTPAVSSSS